MRWHNIHTMFSEKGSAGSKTETDAYRCIDIIVPSYLTIFSC